MVSSRFSVYVIFLSIVFAFMINSAESADTYTKIYYSKLPMYGEVILGLPSGESVIAGTSYEDVYYGFFTKFDANGEVLIQKTYEAEDDAFHILFHSMAQTPDGGFLATGFRAPPQGGEPDDFIVLRLDPLGEIIWKISFGTKLIDQFPSIIATPDGGFVLGGLSGSCCGGGGSGLTNYRGVMIRGSASGKIAWKKMFSIPSNKAGLHPVPTITSASGGYLFVSGMELEKEHFGLLLVKFGGGGAIVWKKAISLGKSLLEDGYYHGPSVSRTSDKGFIVAATTYTEEDHTVESYIDLLKLDESGKVQWAKSYEADKRIEVNGTVLQTSDGGYLIPGAKSYPSDPLLIKVDSSGKPLWANRFLFGPGRADGIFAATETADGGYLATGVIVDTQQPSAPSAKLPLFKFGTSGANDCGNFTTMNLKASSHKVFVTVPILAVEDAKILVRIPQLEVFSTSLTSTNCKVNWE